MTRMTPVTHAATDASTERPAELVHCVVSDAVATITLDSPHNRNALSRQLVTELFAHLRSTAQDDDVSVVVLRSSGRVFCSGADLTEASEGGMEEGARVLVEMQRLIVAHPKPVVAALHGPVRAGGIGIIAAADVVVAADEASFALTEVKLGLAPAVISLTVLPRMTSRAAALTCLTGEPFTAAEAVVMGLVTRAVPAAEVDDAVASVVASLATGAPQGLRETKALLARDLLARIDAQGEDMARLSARLFGSDEAREAMAAFLNRKK
ncbi:putative enoyl-CoA hydratase/isomerase [Nocardioides psychrotolerans]|uniref:Enoyl-CoA hydratase/methylglutaconyl-CoA hydratase n=2 Tax=Nocardioides psychrotolerans TaxID=1005945 RepID=A0A1I3EC85_9ACTN|nr:putative enoyl-CoA hydratase/isomerase [Nocardioides psychrotolerans]SFH96489.1 enoyl-CoA hydratase/methylglutaconyl-CoA hydratase [Nocardioides psychrotolerans]